MKKNNIDDIKNSCVGCLSCINICPKIAIHETLSQDGFLYPCIDQLKCVNCGLCRKVCPSVVNSQKSYPKKSFIAISKEFDKTKKSSSGGMFFSLADYFINNLNGYVCGCVLDDDFNAIHIVSNDMYDIRRMQGSKYVQSKIIDVYDEIQKLLNQGKYVLFTGTPCQCDSLKKRADNHQNLITVDLICHGVPSNALLQKEVDDFKKKYIFDRIAFRYKNKFEKTNYSFVLSGKKIKKYISYKKSGYYSLFMESRSFRKSCYECQYATDKRIGDITIGDCNTWQDYNDFYPEKSVSTILINSKKGEWIWNNISKKIDYKILNYEKEKIGNHQLLHSPDIKQRLTDDELEHLINGYVSLNDYALGLNVKDYIKIFLKKLVTVKTRERLKSVIK